MNPLDSIRNSYSIFTKTEEKIADFILGNPYEFGRNSIDETVKQVKASKPAMIRFAKKLGYSGYSEFKYDVAKFNISESYTNKNSAEDNPIKQVTETYSKYINLMNDSIDIDKLNEMVQCIAYARKVKILAVNRTALSARQLQLRALKIGYDIECVEDRAAMNDVINTMDNRDICLIFSIRDNEHTYAPLVENLKTRGVKTAIFTMTPSLPFIKNCNYSIFLPQLNKNNTQFIDEQVLYFVLDEIILNQLIHVKQQGEQ